MQAVVKHRRLNGVLSILLPLAFGAAFVVLWQTQLLHALLRVDTFVLPLPTRIVSILADNASDVMGNVQATVLVAVLGLALGSLLGYLIAVVARCSPSGERAACRWCRPSMPSPSWPCPRSSSTGPATCPMRPVSAAPSPRCWW